jgi:hypothetical protein
MAHWGGQNLEGLTDGYPREFHLWVANTWLETECNKAAQAANLQEAEGRANWKQVESAANRPAKARSEQVGERAGIRRDVELQDRLLQMSQCPGVRSRPDVLPKLRHM